MTGRRHVRMLDVAEEAVFTEPWRDLRGHSPADQAQRRALHDELIAELKPGHRLHGRSFEIIARSEARDDILVEVDDGTWAVVHLSWAGDRERPPWPVATIFESMHAAMASIEFC